MEVLELEWEVMILKNLMNCPSCVCFEAMESLLAVHWLISGVQMSSHENWENVPVKLMDAAVYFSAW